MLPDIQHAIRLQILDDRVTALTKEIAALPKHIADIEQKLGAHQRRLEHDKAALSANVKDRKRLEGEILTHDQKISKLKSQMMEAKNNDQYRAFQHEIDFAGQETRKAEDRILELMGEAEPLEKNVKAAEASLGDERKHVEAEKAQARERTATDQKEIDTLKSERTDNRGADDALSRLGELRPHLAQRPRRCGHHRNSGWPLWTLQHRSKASVFSRLEKRRDHHDMRKLRSYPLLQSGATRGRSRRQWTPGEHECGYGRR